MLWLCHPDEMNPEEQKTQRTCHWSLQEERLWHCPWKLKNYEKAIELDSKEIFYYNNSAAVCFQMNLWTILTYASSFATKKIEPNQNSSSKVLKEWDDPSWKTRPIFAKMSSLLSI